jgi:hypothetical protein
LKQIAVLLVFLFGSYASVRGRAEPSVKFPDPEMGAVKESVYENAYFGLRYPLPQGWIEDLAGPPPSDSGYYSLSSLKPEGQLTATLLIAAQDDFFSSPPADNASDFLNQMKEHLDSSLAVAPATNSLTISGRRFARLEYTGAGLRHVVFATTVRCHTLIFSLTSGDAAQIRNLTASLEKMSLPASDAQWPACVRDYATAGNITRQVKPQIVGPRFASVPVRIIIDEQGHVVHVHAIAGFPEQIRSVSDAVAQWQFKPFEVQGKPAAVETGIRFQFPQKP